MNTPSLATLSPTPIESCRCHGPSWRITCPEPQCGRPAYAYRSRAGLARSWADDGPSGWVCPSCGARGRLPMALEAAA